MLVEQHPGIAYRDCDHCRMWQYDEQTGQVEKWRGQPLGRVGPPPCKRPVGCSKGSYDNPKELTAANEMAYAHYRRCQAVNRFPDDPLVARNAEVIDAAQAAVERMRQRQQELRRLR